jgi:hypothetical protein
MAKRRSLIKRTDPPSDYLATRMDSLSNGERSDCSVVAISLACDVSYQRAHASLAALGRKSKRGTPRDFTIRAVKDFGYELRKWSLQEMIDVVRDYPGVHAQLHGITSHHLRRFPRAWEKRSRGTLLLFSNRHVLCAKAGVVLDWSINNALRIREIYDVIKN